MSGSEIVSCGWQVVIYVGDVDKSEPRFRNYNTSCLTTGVRCESSNRFNKLVAKGDITTTVIPFPFAGVRAQDISAAEFKELLSASLYGAQRDLGLMIPRHKASGRVLAWANDDTTGELMSMFISLRPQFQRQTACSTFELLKKSGMGVQLKKWYLHPSWNWRTRAS
jgi:hypothetical protein